MANIVASVEPGESEACLRGPRGSEVHVSRLRVKQEAWAQSLETSHTGCLHP